MSRDPNCDFCLGVQGICTECDACFGEHCQCDPCAHGNKREEACVFCGRGFYGRGIDFVDSMTKSESVDIQKDIEWLMGQT
jgi:hypothetical protein